MAETGGVVQRVRTLIQSVGEIGKDLVTSGCGGGGNQVTFWGKCVQVWPPGEGGLM